jgi:uncharacterized protein
MAEQHPEHKHSNTLVHETSPYLLQHAHNPVNWHPWSDDTLQLARNSNKLLLISIGYSACHWCHVMERECFENEEVAEVMNRYFINVKVDREERPDVDQVYMSAVQLMTGRGGWPLNCIALPDGRPLYGGTYFPRAQWLKVIQDVAKLWENEPVKAMEYATELTHGVQQADLLPNSPSKADFNKGLLTAVVKQWSPDLDNVNGGPDRAPKFPMPCNYRFLLRQAHLKKDRQLMDHVHLTLRKMAHGGIYDQVGGGFARYSVDALWKVPHFEKMLYDNAQLVSLYCEAFQASGEPLYKEVVHQTLKFIAREMTSPQGAFYSALDADSDGEEGKYYVWTENELITLLGEDFDWVKDYYNINARGYWENGNHILLRTGADELFAKGRGWDADTLREKVNAVNSKLLLQRETRTRPGLDDKQLTSWNALMLKAYAEAYCVFGEDEHLSAAIRSANFLLNVQRRPDGGLWHSHKDGRSTINGFLEDYCFTIEALISLYQATFDRQWLDKADALVSYVIAHFKDERTGLFHVTSSLDPKLIARKMELSDNVMPSSNSSMAIGLFLLGHLLGNDDYVTMSRKMLANVLSLLAEQGPWYANWASLTQMIVYPFYEVAIVGPKADERRMELERHYRPNKLVAGGTQENGLPILNGRAKRGVTRIYVCQGKTCLMAVDTVKEALGLMKD